MPPLLVPDLGCLEHAAEGPQRDPLPPLAGCGRPNLPGPGSRRHPERLPITAHTTGERHHKGRQEIDLKSCGSGHRINPPESRQTVVQTPNAAAVERVAHGNLTLRIPPPTDQYHSRFDPIFLPGRFPAGDPSARAAGETMRKRRRPGQLVPGVRKFTQAEGKGFEPSTPFGASDFESDRWPIRIPSRVESILEGPCNSLKLPSARRPAECSSTRNSFSTS